jgi:hypothetical protein
MNPEKWKSVVIPIESYRVLKDMAKNGARYPASSRLFWNR